MNAPLLEPLPTPRELKEKFIIPRYYMRCIALWLQISESMVSQMTRSNKKPSQKLAKRLAEAHGIPERIWTDNYSCDDRAEVLYQRWYEYETDQDNPATNI